MRRFLSVDSSSLEYPEFRDGRSVFLERELGFGVSIPGWGGSSMHNCTPITVIKGNPLWTVGAVRRKIQPEETVFGEASSTT
jgi:hypothetical protein